MQADSPNWRVIGDAASPAEAAALDALRGLLPDVGTIAWTNVSFRDPSGNDNEVDAIVLSRHGLFVVELKGWAGSFTGSQFRWEISYPGGKRDERNNPYPVTDMKAKRLKGLLAEAIAGKNRRAYVPYVQAVVAMHGQDSRFDLALPASDHIYRLDGYRVKGLTPLSAIFAGRAETGHPLSQQQVAAAAALFDGLGLRARPKVRMIGQYRISDGDPVGAGPGWEDFSVEHPGVAHIRRRVRVYPIPPKAAKAQQKRIRRSARREYLLTQNLHHPGIVSADDFIDDTQGVSSGSPAVVFPPDPAGELPLNVWLEQHADTLDASARLTLIRKLGEILQYAHKQGVSHRALTPASVRVTSADGRGRAGTPTVRVRDWQTGAIVEDTDDDDTPDTALVGDAHLPDLADPVQWPYLAPEAHQVAHPDGFAMDVYGLGVLAYLIVTGLPPAATLAELEIKLADGGLDPAGAVDSVPDDLAVLITWATAPSVPDRLDSVDEFLEELTRVAADLAARQEDRTPALDPLDAAVEDLIDDAWIVERILGSGSTGRALLVSNGDKSGNSFVLKVANDEAKAHLLIDEVEVLALLDHPRVIHTLGPTIELHGRTCARLEFAGSPTLGRELRDNGRLSWDRLQTLGEDLLEIARYLAERGVHHRDIKPDNLAVRPSTSASKRPSLTIFDFSLSRRPAADIASGTRGYLDPFLGAARGRPTYDSAAERFAVAVTLFEMATGHQPVWGDGQTDPKFAELAITAEMFEGPRPAQVMAFFIKALAADAKERFDSVEAMAAAWQALFAQAPGTVTDVYTSTSETALASEAERDRAAMAVTRTTPLAEAGLTDQALSAMRRVGAENVGDVLALDPVAINNQPGVGRRTSREVTRRRIQWQELLGTQTWVDDTPAGGRSIEDLRAALVPRANARNKNAVAVAKAMVAASPEATMREIAAEAGVSSADLVPAAALLHKFWARNPALHKAAGEVRMALRAANGVATMTEIAVVLVARHGSGLGDQESRLRAALPVVRAVVEADALFGAGELVRNREPSSPVVLIGQRSELLPDPEAAMVAIRMLAVKVDEATAMPPGLIAAPAAEALVTSALELGGVGGSEVGAAVSATSGGGVRGGLGAAPDTGAIPPSRLVRLAALCSAHSDASTRGELYRVGVVPTVTLPRVLHGAGNAVLSEKTLRERVTKRYPKAAPLPPQAELTALVTAAMPGLVWDGTNYARPTSSSLLLSGTGHTSLYPEQDADIAEVRARLQQSLATASPMVLGIDPRRLDRAAAYLADTYGVTPVNLAAELITAAKATAATMRVQWQFLLAVDAAEGADRAKLNQFMARAFDNMWPQLLARPEPLLFTDAAVLARYGLADRLAPVTNLAVPRPAARWILVPHRAAQAVPTFDGAPVPLGADGWLDLPASLLPPTYLPSSAGDVIQLRRGA